MTNIIDQLDVQHGEHDALYRLPASEFERVAQQLGKDYDAVIGLRRCQCGGTWAWLAAGEGFVHLKHEEALNDELAKAIAERDEAWDVLLRLIEVDGVAAHQAQAAIAKDLGDKLQQSLADLEAAKSALRAICPHERTIAPVLGSSFCALCGAVIAPIK